MILTSLYERSQSFPLEKSIPKSGCDSGMVKSPAQPLKQFWMLRFYVLLESATKKTRQDRDKIHLQRRYARDASSSEHGRVPV